MSAFRFERDKFKELVLYVSERSETDPKYGYTKLNKLLFYIDFIAYREFGRPVTGARYQALQWGPAPTAMKPVEVEMVELGDLLIRPTPWGHYEQKKPIALRQPDLAKFSGQEIALIDGLLNRFWDMDASQVSEFSHEEVGWRLARPGQEEIPYEAAFIESIELVQSA